MSANITKKYEKQHPDVTYVGDWSGLDPGVSVVDENASSQQHACGTFGISGEFKKALCKGSGSTSEPFRRGIDYQYTKRLDASISDDSASGYGSVDGGYVDTSSTGALSNEKYIRITENSKSITSSTGLCLKVFARNLTTIKYPPGDRAYIDPVNGKFVLPQPSYWNKCETIDEATTPTIGKGSISTNKLSNLFIDSGKFGSCYKYSSSQLGERSGIFYKTNIATGVGTISFWAMGVGLGANDRVVVGSFFGNNRNFGGEYVCNVRSRAYYGDPTTPTYISNFNFSSQWHHFYCTFDSLKRLEDGKSARVWVDGIEVFNESETFSSGEVYFWQYCETISSGSFAYIDNMKVWNHVVSEDATFISNEYNSGAGLENTIHAIYDSYIPQDIKVSYSYINYTSTPATCPPPGSNEIIELEDAASLSYTSGYFGGPFVLRKNDYTAFVENVDFEYNKLLDASISEDPTNGFGSVSGGTYDTSTGSFSLNKFFRIVHNGQNIKSTSTGTLGLSVYAKDLSFIENKTPTADKCYVDPLRGKFILPKPVYWSKCESLLNVTDSPEIGDKFTTVLEDAPSYGWSTQSGLSKWGSGLRGEVGGGETERLYLYPFYETTTQKGAMSFWGRTYTWGTVADYEAYLRLNLGASTYILIHTSYIGGSKISIYVDGVEESTKVYDWNNYLRHIFVTWDGASTGKTIQFYMDGTEQLFSSTGFNTYSPYLYGYGRCNAGYGLILALDNIKFWKDFIDDPNFEYNSGTGREDALHSIYGSSNNYKPILTSTGAGGVGFYKAGGAGTYAIWQIGSNQYSDDTQGYDTTPPSPVSLLSVFANESGDAVVQWSEGTDPNTLGYLVYFTNEIGNWRSVVALEGKSPVDTRTPTIESSVCSFTIHGLEPNIVYYFYVTTYDTAYNESIASNILPCSLIKNMYRLSGTPTTGMYTDYTNPNEGTPLNEWEKFPYTLPLEIQPGAVYESGVHTKLSGFSTMVFTATGNEGDVLLQIKTSDDGVTWSSWSDPIDATMTNTADISGSYMMYRVVFAGTYWTDGDSFIVEAIV